MELEVTIYIYLQNSKVGSLGCIMAQFNLMNSQQPLNKQNKNVCISQSFLIFHNILNSVCDQALFYK
jgi:hypothetical protein